MNEARGSNPAFAFEDANNQNAEHKFATVNELRSLWERNSSSDGKIADVTTVRSCKTDMTGQMRKTQDAGVMLVGNRAANSELVVDPTVCVNAAARVIFAVDDAASAVAVKGPIPIMDAMEMRKK